MDSFEIHFNRLSKFSLVVYRLHNLNKLPDSFDIPDDILDSSSISELVDYVISNYHV